ncbi:alpha/beta fold hydrolase [Streptomyces halobius]|uniref:Alpha/beta fold hydrolase n=1 Tax=Streptomyces halobius TaxID=2879846 RepID=A0ABY4MI05_9ACTN|nr:alpha/beta fold hydrolase [Streptomyces halobius]
MTGGVEAQPKSAAEPWLRRFHPAPSARARLVCAPHAGGAATAYHGLSERLAPDVEVLTVQYPGRQDRRHEPFADSIGEIADRLAEVLPATGADGAPLILFGHSMGSAVVFELARRLPPDAVTGVIVSGRGAPSQAVAKPIRLHDEAALLKEMRLLDGTDADVFADQDLLRMVLPAVQADYRIIQAYQAEESASIDAPLTVFNGDADPRVSVDAAAAWQQHSTGRFRSRVFPGGHFYLDDLSVSFAEHVREAIEQFLDDRFLDDPDTVAYSYSRKGASS